MLTRSDHGYVRTPRDLSRCVEALSEAAAIRSREVRRRAVNHLGLHPEGSALHALTYMNTYLQVRDCSLHALDGGGTMKHLIFMGNYLYACEKGNRSSKFVMQHTMFVTGLDDVFHKS